jgi:hypothetical protein
MRHTFIVLAAISLALLAMALAAAPGVAEGEEDTVLFLHWVNDEEPSRDLGGHSVRNLMDTTTEFEAVNRSVTSGAKWDEDWYLHPLLAEDLTTDNVTLGLWMNASGGQKRAQISITLLDVADASSDPYGSSVAEANFGNTPLFATPHFMTFSLDFDPYTFRANHTIRVLISMTPGTSTFVTIIWDTPTADSRVTIRTADRLSIRDLGVKDADGEPTTGLDPLADDTGVTLYTVMGDPLGVYDVADVRVTLEGPDGSIIIDNVSMDGPDLPRGASPAEFNLQWDHDGAEAGRYTLTVWAVDLSGVSYRDHFGHGTLGAYTVVATSQFSIGEVFSVAVLCLDGGDRPVEGAQVSAALSDDPVATDEEGRALLEVFGGTVTLTATWHGVQVGTLTRDVDSDVPASDPAVIECAIFDVTLRAVDGRGDPLADATVQVTPPAGWGTTVLDRTDSEGQVTLGLIPGADHSVRVLWRGFSVADSVFSPEADGVIDVPCAVHWATFHVTDADGGPLPSVQLAAMDEANLGVVGFGTTDGSGDLALRLPDNTYRVEIYWRNTMVLREDGLVLDGEDLDKNLGCSVFQATLKVADRDGRSLADVPVVLKDGTGAVVGTAITDAKGLVVFQVGQDVYDATAHLQTTYRWTAIDMEEGTAMDVNGSTTHTLKFDEYPPGIIGTVQLWTIVVVLLMFLVMMYLVLLLRSRTDPSSLEPAREVEEDAGAPDDDEEDKASVGIDVEAYSSADLIRDE